MDRMVQERVEQERLRLQAAYAAQDKAIVKVTPSNDVTKHAERYHVDLLRRETLDLIEKQKRMLPTQFEVDKEATEAEKEVIKCYR